MKCAGWQERPLTSRCTGPRARVARSRPVNAGASPQMQRKLITGNAGSGKTSLARALAVALNLPYVGLDRVVWKPGWISTPKTERKEQESAIARNLVWVVDGVSDMLLQEADTVIFLDVPRLRCFWRVFLRNLPYLFHSRPGLQERCPEITIIPTLVKIIWRFPKLVRPGILEVSRSKSKHFFHIRTNAQLETFLKQTGVTWM
ncbi:MAG: putative kinase [Nitrospira sp.]|nr:putative kinase [Nitrospira sp.]